MNLVMEFVVVIRFFFLGALGKVIRRIIYCIDSSFISLVNELQCIYFPMPKNSTIIEFFAVMSYDQTLIIFHILNVFSLKPYMNIITTNNKYCF